MTYQVNDVARCFAVLSCTRDICWDACRTVSLAAPGVIGRTTRHRLCERRARCEAGLSFLQIMWCPFNGVHGKSCRAPCDFQVGHSASTADEASWDKELQPPSYVLHPPAQAVEAEFGSGPDSGKKKCSGCLGFQPLVRKREQGVRRKTQALRARIMCFGSEE